MHVPLRKPCAHQVAASLTKSFKGCHVYVESGIDCKFWKFFVNRTSARLHACNGWPDVVKSVEMNNSQGNLCIGIIDNDFRALFTYPDKLPHNVFTSDEHDIEMMFLNSDAAERVITHYDASNQIDKFESVDGPLLDFVYAITNRIGLVKLLNQKEGLNMIFKKEGKNGLFDIPSYEDFLDKTCHYKSDKSMINVLTGWSRNQKHVPSKTNESIISLLIAEMTKNYDTLQLTCGHDACYVLAYILWKRIANKKVSQSEVEDMLSVSYTEQSLKGTQLYHDIEDWSQGRGVNVLRV